MKTTAKPCSQRTEFILVDRWIHGRVQALRLERPYLSHREAVRVAVEQWAEQERAAREVQARLACLSLAPEAERR